MPYKDRERNNEYFREYYKKYPEKRVYFGKEYARQQYYKHKDRWREKYNAKKFLVLQHYSNTSIPFCKCCGEKEIKFLTVDHINGGGRKHREREKIKNMYEWAIKNNFPDGFQILCYNCNCAKGHNGTCPHQEKSRSNK